ncbi:GntR family transcriptional regulator [Rhodococcus sp. IEGM 1379]|uniref:GntR family transcriptional regulator n=1 Tax=Rhodococcus sp. IEGM 1379 TaxID=3047086 RepID=UPI0024B69A3B|nr:GntR family transcriptional regulator [Rhodococcus sp. IEGM 1379]MDI9917173.1 GntR family transcriptional regulator [Rhodococcus sp. IEGM 1379]
MKEPTGAQRCLQQIRQMIVSGELLPGQKVHQAELAERLNVSRIPVREALSTLQAEGVLEHKSNTGYAVARFSSEDLFELYLMRRLLETEILASIDLSSVDVAELERIQKQVDGAEPAEEGPEFQIANHRFHFRLFEYSPLQRVRQEVERLWYMSDFYRALYIHESSSRQQISEDHERILQAVRDQDTAELIRASDEHRSVTEVLVVTRLGRSRPR